MDFFAHQSILRRQQDHNVVLTSSELPVATQRLRIPGRVVERQDAVGTENGLGDRDPDADPVLVDGTGETVALAVGRDLPDQVVQMRNFFGREDLVRIADVGRGTRDPAVLRHEDRIGVLL